MGLLLYNAWGRLSQGLAHPKGRLRALAARVAHALFQLVRVRVRRTLISIARRDLFIFARLVQASWFLFQPHLSREYLTEAFVHIF